jgi:hypothetical protein
MARIIREYYREDRPALDALHASHGKNYWYADPDDEINFVTWVLEEDGKIVASVTARRTAEAFFMLDKSWGTPRERLAATEQLIEHCVNYAHDIGLREIHIGVGANERGWLKRLLKLKSMFLDNRYHILMSVWHRFKGD